MIVAICWPRDYEVSYEVDGYDVIERFDKEIGHYFLSIELDDIIYSMPLESKQLGSKHLVKSVSVVTDDEATCVLMKGDKILSYPVCRDGEKYVDYSLSGLEDGEFYEREKIAKTNEEYDGVSILGDLGFLFITFPPLEKTTQSYCESSLPYFFLASIINDVTAVSISGK